MKFWVLSLLVLTQVACRGPQAPSAGGGVPASSESGSGLGGGGRPTPTAQPNTPTPQLPAPTPTAKPNSPTPTSAPLPTAIPTPTSKPTVPTPTPISSGTDGAKLEILSGNGQGMLSFWPFGQPFTVRLLSKTGAPLAGVKIGFTPIVNPDSILLRQSEAITDAQGIAMLEARSGTPNAQMEGKSTTLAQPIGVYSYLKAEFYTFCVPQNSSGTTMPLYALVKPEPLSTIEMSVGQRLKDAIQAQFNHSVTPFIGQPLSQMGFQVSVDNPLELSDPPVAECEGYTALSNSAGLASCDLVLRSGQPGQYTLKITYMGGATSRNLYLKIK